MKQKIKCSYCLADADYYIGFIKARDKKEKNLAAGNAKERTSVCDKHLPAAIDELQNKLFGTPCWVMVYNMADDSVFRNLWKEHNELL